MDLINNVLERISNNRKAAPLFLDLKKAFHTINHYITR